MKKAKLASILKKAEQISKAIELEAEEILEDAELAVKESVPACNVSKALKLIEKKLEDEGIEALFQKNVSKVAIKKTASESLSDEELEDLIEVIVEAVIEEFEEILEDADEVCDEEVKALIDEESDAVIVESKLKSVLERKLFSKGIYSKFARTAKPVKVEKKVSVSEKAKSIMAKKRAARK